MVTTKLFLITIIVCVPHHSRCEDSTIRQPLPPDVAHFFGQSRAQSSPFDAPRIVEGIEIIGNKRTRRSVILSQLSLAVGALVEESAIEASRIRLLSTGFFRTVRFSLRRGSARGRVLLVLELTERNTLRVEDLTVGFGPRTASFGALGLSETNFLGRGVTVAGAGAVSRNQRAFELHIFAPNLSGTPLQLSASMAWIVGQETIDPTLRDNSPTLDYERLGGTLGLGFGAGPARRISFLYRLESVNSNRLPNISPPTLRRAPSILSDSSVLSTLELAWERDTRDDDFAPTRGTRIALAVEVGSSVIGSGYEFSKYTGDLEYAFRVRSGDAIVLHAFGGLIQGETPFFNQFFLRDFAPASYGPPALPRAVQLNFSQANDYDDLLIDAGAEYTLLLHEKKDSWLGRLLLYGALSFTVSGSLEEAQADIGGRGAFSVFPLYADAGLKLDTIFGRFTLSIAYTVDLAL